MALVAKVMIEWFLVVFSVDLNDENNLQGVASSLYGIFPVPLGQFPSVTYPRRTEGKLPARGETHIFAWTT